MSKKPLIRTEALSEFGDLTEQADFHDPQGMDQDYTYVPGYSQQRRAAELAIAEVKRGERSAKDIPVLDAKLVWVRNQKISGTPDTSRVYEHQQDGFNLVTKEDVGKKPWITDVPPGATLQADGTIRMGDAVLMACSREAAQRQEIRQRNETEARMTGAENSFTAKLQEMGKQIFGPNMKGLDPTVTELKPGEPSFAKGKK